MAIFDKKTEKENKSAKASMKDLYSEKKADAGKKESKNFGNAYKILVKPLITEKGTVLNAENKYVFEVASGANKIEVAKAIKEVYGISPEKVNIVRVLGKNTRFGRTLGKRKDWKKAIVTLPKGKEIQVYEGV